MNKVRIQTEEFGKFLKEKRTQSGISQAQIAEQLGYKQSQFISNIERGLSSPPLPVIKSMIDAYGINVDDIIKKILGIQKQYLMAKLK